MKYTVLHFVVTLVIFLSTTTISFARAPDWGAADNFFIFSAKGAAGTNCLSQLTGEIGAPSAAITGFENVKGFMLDNDAATSGARKALPPASDDLNAIPGNFTHASLLGDGATLKEGVYAIAGTSMLSLNLSLNTEGDTNAVVIIKISGTLSIDTSSSITPVNGAMSCRVFSKVKRVVSMATAASMKGNVIANNAAIDMSAGVKHEGSARSIISAKNLDPVTATMPEIAENAGVSRTIILNI